MKKKLINNNLKQLKDEDIWLVSFINCDNILTTKKIVCRDIEPLIYMVLNSYIVFGEAKKIRILHEQTNQYFFCMETI